MLVARLIVFILWRFDSQLQSVFAESSFASDWPVSKPSTDFNIPAQAVPCVRWIASAIRCN